MSAITGVYAIDQEPVDPHDFDLMLQSLAFRGPDGTGRWVNGPVALGHLMLHTTPEALNERQPLVNDAGDMCLTADARVDNREELKNAVEDTGMVLRDNTDAELILRAYEVWGETCPAKILGDFAFAIWDGRRRQLFCARDPVGIKPFFYSFDGRVFRWASSPRALFADGRLAREPNRTLLGLYLLRHVEDPEATLYQGVFRLPGAHGLVVDASGLRKARYWDVSPHKRLSYRTDEEYAEHFLDLFKAGVRGCLRSLGPPGALLSGGLDSSAIVCVAKWLERDEGRSSREPLEAFSLRFRNQTQDEGPYRKAVLDAWSVPSTSMYFEDNLAAVDFERVADFPDGYYLFTLQFMAPLCRAARQRGIRVFLDGIGGDDLLAVDFSHLTDLLRAGRWLQWLNQFRHDVRHSKWSLRRIFWRHCVTPFIPGGIKRVINGMLHPVRADRLPAWVDVAGLRQAGVLERLKHRVVPHGFPTQAQQTIYEALGHDWNAMVALPAVDCFSAALGLEFRHPFFHRPLIEFLLAVPEEQRWRGPWRKWILRRALDGILPTAVGRRKDKGQFSWASERDWKQRQAHKIDALLRTSVLGQLGLVNPLELVEGFADYQKSSGKKLDSSALNRIIWLELWCRANIMPSSN